MSIWNSRRTAITVTVVLVAAALLIGWFKATENGKKLPKLRNADREWYVVDGAGVLSSSTRRELQTLNMELYRDMDVVIAVVTSGRPLGDLYQYGLDAAREMELKENDFLVVLDMGAEHCHLLQGAGLVEVFTDQDCLNYVDRYMLDNLKDGDCDEAVLDLTWALSEWYYANYLG